MIPAWTLAMMESAAAGFTPLDLGSKLVAWWAPPSPGDNVTLNGSAISAWTDEVGAYALGQATAADQPLYDASSFGGLACAEFDGAGDHLFLEGVPASFPVGSDPAEVWFSCRQDVPASTGGSKNSFGYGGANTADRRQCGRWVQGGVNRALAVAGNGSGQVVVDNGFVDFSGAHVVRTVFGASFRVDVDGTAGTATSLTAATGTMRVVLGTNTARTGSVSWVGAIREVLVIDGDLTADEATALYAWMNGGA